MRKQLSAYLLICSAFTFLTSLTYASDSTAVSSASASITSADSFFTEAKKPSAKLDQLFQQATPQAKDEIARAVQDSKATAESLGVSAMLFSKLKSNSIINSHTPAASSANANVGSLTASRLTMQQNTVGAATGEHRVGREIGIVDKSAFTKAEQEAEAQRKQREFGAKFASLQRAETEARGSLQTDATQVGSSMAENNALQVSEITGRVDTTAAENSDRDSLQKDFTSATQQLGLQSNESANRGIVVAPEAVERNNLQAAFAQGAFQANESTTRNNAKTLEESERENLAKAYAESGATALAAANRRELQEAEARKRATDVTTQEAVARAQIEAARDQSLHTARAAEAQRKQREFDAQFAGLEKQEETDRANTLSLSNAEWDSFFRSFQTDKKRTEEEQIRKATEAIAAALAEAKLSMEIQLENHLAELHRIQEDLLQKLQSEKDEKRTKELQEKQTQLTILTKQASEIKQEAEVARDTAQVFGQNVAEIMLAYFQRPSTSRTEVEHFQANLRTQSFEQIISKIKEFITKGMLERNIYINRALDEILTIHGARLNRLDELGRKIDNLKR